MRIRIKVALMREQGPLMEETDLEVARGVTLGRAFKQADKSLGLPRGLFKSCLKGRIAATILLNGDPLDPKRLKSHRLEPDDEISVLSGLAGG